MRKTYVLTLAVFLFSLSVIVVLYLMSDKLNHAHNTFVRLLPPHPIRFEKALDVKYTSYYIAGVASNHVYLGNFAAPLHLLDINTVAADTQHVRLTIDDPDLQKFRTIKVRVDSPVFYITDGVRPALLKGETQTWRARRYMYDSAYFTDAVPLGPGSFAIRSISSSTHSNVLSKENRAAPNVQEAPGLLIKQVDGLFCTDGMMHFNRELNMVVYLYHYRNQYLCMDTSLNLLYAGKTIDTVSRAQVKVASITSDNVVTLASPPLMVNKKSSASGNYLFVNSGLQAKNEDAETFNQAAVIDVYSLRDGVYQFSFYIYDFNDEKLQAFKVSGDKLVALFNHYVVVYSLAERYFK
jgi:hypothetical protein